MYPLSFLFLFLLWIIFSGRFDAMHLGLGVLCCAFLSLSAKDMLFRKKISLINRVKLVGRFFVFLVWLAGQIIVSNFYILYLVFHPKMRKLVSPEIVDIDVSKLKIEDAKVLLAQSITLTPGTLTLTLDEQFLKVYAINQSLVGGLQEMYDKVYWVFQSDE